MIQWLLRGLILLWAVFFGLVAVQGILNPSVFGSMFALDPAGAGGNTLRADLGAFFLVAAGAAALGALALPWVRALLVPAALFGTAFVGRMIGIVQGDPGGGAIGRAMLIEAMSVVLMIGSWWILSHRQTADPVEGASSGDPAV